MTDAMFTPLVCAPPEPQPAGAWRAVIPVPANAPPPPAAHPTRGRPAARWTYRDRNGDDLGYIDRFNNAHDSKTFLPLTWCRRDDAAAGAWRWQSWLPPRPLYGLDRLAAMPDAPVVVCEGEKAADAAARLLPDHVTVTSPGGARSAAKADWTALADRHVTIWPDADAAGGAYAQDVAVSLRALGIEPRMIVPPPGVPEGWDAADALAAGWTGERAHELVTQASLPAKSANVAPSGSRNGPRIRRGRGRGETSPQEQLVALTDAAELWHDGRRQPYATVPTGGCFENWPVGSNQFRMWLIQRARAATGKIPTGHVVDSALDAIRAKAIFDGATHEPHLRVAERAGAVYVDLCHPLWRAVEITPDGWRIVERPPVKFLRSGTMRALPEPVRDERGIELLRPLINVATDDDFTLIVAFILAAFSPHGPYPVLLINGEQGSAKSTTAHLIQSLIDPNEVRGRSLPRDERDLFVTTEHAYALFFDNVSAISGWLSDALARIATGGGFATRRLRTDTDEVVFNATRPICINGIPDLASRADLADRSMTVSLVPISEEQRRTEKEMLAMFRAIQPAALGALFDAVSGSLRNLEQTVLTSKTRMADCERWVTAGETALGWEPGTFGRAYRENRSDALALGAEYDPVTAAIETMMRTRDTAWEGTARELLDMLDHQVPEGVRKSRRWPTTPRGLSDALTRAIPTLRHLGIEVTRSRVKTRDRARIITLVRRGVG